MDNSSKIYVAGHTGLVGSAIAKSLETRRFTDLIFKKSSELNLEIQSDVEAFFKKEKPEYVFLAAAKVGGIQANNTLRADFIYKNLQIQNNVIHYSWKYGAKKLLFLASNCIYPRESRQPMKEEYLLTGPLEATNEPFAVAKIAGIKMCESYNRQHGTNFISAVPANIYGPNDNFDLNNSHLIPAVISKFHNAKTRNDKFVTLWGTGKPRREGMFSEDAAEAFIFLMENYNSNEIINVGNGQDMDIKQIAKKIASVVGFKGDIEFDHSKPDGMERKLLDTSKLKKLGWEPKTAFDEGIKKTYQWFLKNENKFKAAH